MPEKQTSHVRPLARELIRAYGGKTRSEAIENAVRRYDANSRELALAVMRHLRESGCCLDRLAALELYVQEVEANHDS